MQQARTEVGRKPGYKQVTLYVEPVLYERVKHAAYSLDEDVYVFVEEALGSAVDRRMTRLQRVVIDSMVQQNIKNRTHAQKRR